jgi:hypothetical protein
MQFELLAYSFPLLTVFFWMLAVILWVAIAFWPASVAAAKGHSFWGYFLLSLFFFPLALLLAYLSKNRASQQPMVAP